MLVVAFIIALAVTFIGWYLSRDLFAPYVAVSGVWSIAIVIYYVLPNTFYPISHDFPFVLSVWLVGFFVSSAVCDHFTPSASLYAINRQPNRTVLKAYVIITCLSMPVVCGAIVKQAFLEDPENMFRYMRMMSTGQDENIEMPNLGILLYFVSLGFVMMFFSLLYFKSKKLKALIIFLNLLLAAVTMAKTSFLGIMFSSMYLCYNQKIIKIRHLLYGLLAFVALSFVIQSVRAVGEEMETTNFLALYLSSSMVAFDYYAVPCSSHLFGMHTLRIVYAIGHALGITDAPADTILEFVSVPDITNTYTNMYPFYEDFGIVGVFVFSVVYGMFYGYLYKKTRTGGKFELMLYAIFLTFVMMEFIGEFIFTNLSTSLQYVFFAAIPFLFGKSEKADGV